MIRLLVVACAACGGDLDAPLDPLTLDAPFFACRVQPVLTKYCSALACHGADGRYFHVFARNRARLTGDETQRNAFLSDAERAHNFDAARALIDPSAPTDSVLVLKPLEQAAGGYFHVGATLYGRGNVFATRDDDDYQTLVQWATGSTEDPTCQEPGSTL
ncbi:MAG: hypothetical protein QM831_23885 [Kofleriaceae bacterium]